MIKEIGKGIIKKERIEKERIEKERIEKERMERIDNDILWRVINVLNAQLTPTKKKFNERSK